MPDRGWGGSQKSPKKYHVLFTGDARYMWYFYLRFCEYVIETLTFQRSITSNLAMLLVSLQYANFLGPHLSHFTRKTCIHFHQQNCIQLQNAVTDLDFCSKMIILDSFLTAFEAIIILRGN